MNPEYPPGSWTARDVARWLTMQGWDRREWEYLTRRACELGIANLVPSDRRDSLQREALDELKRIEAELR